MDGKIGVGLRVVVEQFQDNNETIYIYYIFFGVLFLNGGQHELAEYTLYTLSLEKYCRAIKIKYQTSQIY
jgi:hypothetical protein